MNSISLLVVDFLLAALVVICGGIPIVTRPNGAIINVGYVFAVLLFLLLFLQVFKAMNHYTHHARFGAIA